MYINIRQLVVLAAAVLMLVPAGVSNSRDTASQVAEAASADIPDADCRRALDLIFSGHPGEATTYIDSLESRYGHSPLYRLTRARVYREFLPIDDERKDVVKKLAEPIHTDIDLAIDECTRRMETGDSDPRLLLYRGWGWMFKSHIRTFERSFWTAGRDAKKGKSDLTEYLAVEPDDPVANGIMGAFLYFADTLPAAFKFISKLLFMPSGDRDEGLRLMVRSSGEPSLIEMDNKTLLFSVYLAFEGRYEDGLTGFARLHRRYPNYPAFIRPFVITLPFTPQRVVETRRMIDRLLEARAGAPPCDLDLASFALLRFSRAYADRFFDPATAKTEFEALIADAPEHPDWLPGYARFELARMAASRGDYEEARTWLRGVLEDESSAYLHSETRSMLDALDEPAPPSVLDGVPIADIYTAERDRVADIAARLQAMEPRTVQTDFYLGEALLRVGDYPRARAVFQQVVEYDVPVWDEEFQMIACSRVAEIAGSGLDYEVAARYLDKAPDFYHKEFLYDWLYEGRERFFTRLANREYDTIPSLFSTVR